jgi:hypothetical protein
MFSDVKQWARRTGVFIDTTEECSSSIFAETVLEDHLAARMGVEERFRVVFPADIVDESSDDNQRSAARLDLFLDCIGWK